MCVCVCVCRGGAGGGGGREGLGAGGGGGGWGVGRGSRGRGRVTTGLDIQPETFYHISGGEDLNVCLHTRTEVCQWVFNQIKYIFIVH